MGSCERDGWKLARRRFGGLTNKIARARDLLISNSRMRRESLEGLQRAAMRGRLAAKAMG
jgi:hypothetical protein